MEATISGMNRTGAFVSPEGTEAMTRAANELTPPMPVDTSASDAERLGYINESSAVGSVPAPVPLQGVIESGVAEITGDDMSILLDKIGERIAYERSGVRLYEALITKHQAVSELEGILLPTVEELAAMGTGSIPIAPVADETAAETLLRIRKEELEHFRMLGEAMQQLGGDPTAQTPCADVVGTASMGFMQVLADPRTTLAQCLNTLLAVELTDNAGWELLIQLADDAGEDELSASFLTALGEEQQHLAIVKEWLSTLVSSGQGTAAV
jgi:rubrerythrin